MALKDCYLVCDSMLQAYENEELTNVLYSERRARRNESETTMIRCGINAAGSWYQHLLPTKGPQSGWTCSGEIGILMCCCPCHCKTDQAAMHLIVFGREKAIDSPGASQEYRRMAFPECTEQIRLKSSHSTP